MTPQRWYGDSVVFYVGVQYVTIVLVQWVVLNWFVYSQFQRLTHNQ